MPAKIATHDDSHDAQVDVQTDAQSVPTGALPYFIAVACERAARVPIPAPDELTALIRQAREARRLRIRQLAIERIIESQYRLVVFLALRIHQTGIASGNKRVKAHSTSFLFGTGYSLAHIELDDLVQEGLVAVFKTINTYDPERGFKFQTIAGTSAFRAIRDFVNHRKSRALCRQEFESEYQGDSGNTTHNTLFNIPDHRNGTMSSDAKHLAEMIGLLDRRQALLVKRLHGVFGEDKRNVAALADEDGYWNGMPVGEINKEYNTAMLRLQVIARREQAMEN